MVDFPRLPLMSQRWILLNKYRQCCNSYKMLQILSSFCFRLSPLSTAYEVRGEMSFLKKRRDMISNQKVLFFRSWCHCSCILVDLVTRSSKWKVRTYSVVDRTMNKTSLLDLIVALHTEDKNLLQEDYRMEEVEAHYFVVEKMMLADMLLEQRNVRSQ